MMFNTRIKVVDQPFSEKLRSYIAHPPQGSIKMTITPEMALEMLTFNTRNRPVAQGKVEVYARQMLAGDWRYTRVPVIFSDEGRVIDGQHRLHAVIEAGAPIESDVAFGAPDEAFAFIDIGKTRTAGDIFAINGVTNSAAISAITKWVFMYDAGYRNTSHRDSPTHAELYDYLVGHPEIELGRLVFGRFQKNRLATPSIMAGCYVVAARKSKRQADEFFQIASEGFGAETRYHPALVLHGAFVRSATSNEKLTRTATAGLTLNAWNRFRDGLSGRGLKFDPNAPFPRAR